MVERSTEVDQISQKLEIQRSNYEWQLNCINSADSKAGFLVTMNLALVGFILTQFDEIYKTSTLNKIPTNGILLLSIISVSTVLSLYYAAKVIWPRLSKGVNSIFYFISIRRRTLEQYSKEIECTDAATILSDLNNQVWILSGITHNKFKNIRNGIIAYGVSILVLLLIYLDRSANG